MKQISDEINRIATDLDCLYLRAINETDLNQNLQSLEMGTNVLIAYVDNTIFTFPEVQSNYGYAMASIRIFVFIKNTKPDNTAPEIDTLLQEPLRKALFLYDELTRSGLKYGPIDIEDYELNPADSIELTDEIISGYEMTLNFPVVREIYSCPEPPPPIYGPEVQAVLDRMVDLTELEIAAINKFVQAEVDNGNYSLYDEFYSFGLNGVNALTGFKDKTAINNGAVLSVAGAEFFGAEWIDSNYNPAVDGVNYKLDDAQAGVFVVGVDKTTAANLYMFGGRNLTEGVYLFRNASFSVRGGVNALTHTVQSTQVLDNTLYASIRLDSANIKVYRDGVEYQTDLSDSVGLPSQPVYLGCMNNQGAAVDFLSQSISTFIAGAAIGFNQAAHYTNLHAYLTELGTFGPFKTNN